MTLEAKDALKLAEDVTQHTQALHLDLQASVSVIVCTTSPTPTGVLWQPLGPLEWVHVPNSPPQHPTPYHVLVCDVVQKARVRFRQLLAAEPSFTVVPYNAQQQAWLWPTSEEWQSALANFPGKIDCHYLSNKLLQFLKDTPLIFPKTMHCEPTPSAIPVYTDASSAGTAAVHTPEGTCSHRTHHCSARKVQLELYPEQSFNVYTDSIYVFTVFHTVETAVISQATTEEVFHLFHMALVALRRRTRPVYVGYLHAHTGLPGPLTAGNVAADATARELPPKGLTLLSESPLLAAQHSYQLFHQNSPTLKKQFGITREQARQIVCTCQNCHSLSPTVPLDVNPGGLVLNQIWQMDVTHVPSFKNTPFVHVSLDTYSGFICASPRSGEASKHIISHCLHAFSILGIPTIIKLIKGLDTQDKSSNISVQPFRSNTWWEFLITLRAKIWWKEPTSHLKISYSNRNYGTSPTNQLNLALFTFNFLSVDEQGLTAADQFWTPQNKKFALVRWKDPLTGLWQGPDPALIWGRGHVSVFPKSATGPHWLPK